MSATSQRKLSVQWVDPKSLKPHKTNAKTHPDEQVEAIARQIDTFGWDQPIVVDKRGCVVKGHGRLKAALLREMRRVPVYYADHLSAAQAKAARIADNKVAESAWDPGLLKIELMDLQGLDFDLGLTGFGDLEIASIMDPPNAETMFTENNRKDVGERKNQYDNSDFRQVILVMDPEKFEAMMTQFADAQHNFGVETNLEVVERLFEFYAENRSPEGRPDGPLP